MAAKRKKSTPAIAPDFLERQRAQLRRSHRQVIYLNDKELAAIDEYCRRFKVESRSALIRKATMQRVLEALSSTHPTLF